jgi:hypothetical protein
MHALKRVTGLAIVSGLIAMAASGSTWAAPMHRGSPGECGEYKYWHAGHCVDARQAPGKASPAGIPTSGGPLM